MTNNFKNLHIHTKFTQTSNNSNDDDDATATAVWNTHKSFIVDEMRKKKYVLKNEHTSTQLILRLVGRLETHFMILSCWNTKIGGCWHQLLSHSVCMHSTETELRSLSRAHSYIHTYARKHANIHIHIHKCMRTLYTNIKSTLYSIHKMSKYIVEHTHTLLNSTKRRNVQSLFNSVVALVCFASFCCTVTA